MRASRRSERPIRHLDWRIRLFGVGAVLALAGMALGWEWLVNVAIGILIVGFALRFVPERDPEEGAEEEDG